MKCLRSPLMKPIIASGLLFVGLAIVALAGDIAPDTSLANTSNFQIEQVARVEAIGFYHPVREQNLLVDVLDTCTPTQKVEL